MMLIISIFFLNVISQLFESRYRIGIIPKPLSKLIHMSVEFCYEMNVFMKDSILYFYAIYVSLMSKDSNYIG